MQVKIKTWDELKATDGVEEHDGVLVGPDGVWFRKRMDNDAPEDRVVEVEPTEIDGEEYKGQYYLWNMYGKKWTIPPWSIKDL